MIYESVLILRSVLDVIRTEVKKAPRTETGGALAGYLHENHVVVTHACGPGPRAELKRTSVLIDGQYADAFCTRLFKQSHGRIDHDEIEEDGSCIRHSRESGNPVPLSRFIARKSLGPGYRCAIPG